MQQGVILSSPTKRTRRYDHTGGVSRHTSVRPSPPSHLYDPESARHWLPLWSSRLPAWSIPHLWNGLGAASAAGLGAATALLSGAVLWIFNFLGVGTQTEVAQAMGARKAQQVGSVASLGMLLAVLLGLGLTAHHLAGNASAFPSWMSADAVRADEYANLSAHSPARCGGPVWLSPLRLAYCAGLQAIAHLALDCGRNESGQHQSWTPS